MVCSYFFLLCWWLEILFFFLAIITYFHSLQLMSKACVFSSGYSVEVDNSVQVWTNLFYTSSRRWKTMIHYSSLNLPWWNFGCCFFFSFFLVSFFFYSCEKRAEKQHTRDAHLVLHSSFSWLFIRRRGRLRRRWMFLRTTRGTHSTCRFGAVVSREELLIDFWLLTFPQNFL